MVKWSAHAWQVQISKWKSRMAGYYRGTVVGSEEETHGKEKRKFSIATHKWTEKQITQRTKLTEKGAIIP